MKDYQTDTLNIPIVKINDGDWCVVYFADELFAGIVTQGKTEQEAKERLYAGLKSWMSMSKRDHRMLNQRAAFISYRSKNHFWFRIIGLGLTLNWLKGESVERIRKSRRAIRPKNSIRIGRLLIFFTNAWNWNKQIKQS